MNGTQTGTPMAGPPKGAGESDLLRVVGIILMVVGGLGALYQAFSLIANRTAQPPDLSQLPPEYHGFVQATASWAPLIGTLALIISVLVIVGGLQMVKRKSYPLAMTGAIAGSIPCIGPCVCLAMPFGIWALVLLLRPDVKASFASSGGTGAPPAGPGGVTQIG